MRSLARHVVVLVLLGACALTGVADPARAAFSPPTSRLAADLLATTPGGRDRNRALAAWAKRASFDDVLWVLRHGPELLGSAEAVLVEVALKRVPRDRMGLARQLRLRAALLEPEDAKKGLARADLERLRPRASVFRIALLLPDTGDYSDFATSVHRGVLAGVAFDRSATAPPLEVVRVGTGDEDVARAIAAYDSVSRRCAVTIGTLLSVPTLAIAAASRALSAPLISPTATDESIGRVGASISQVGPGQRERARVLARASVAAGQRVALVGNRRAMQGEFARSFVAEAESLGADIVRRELYAEGGGDFRAIARSLKAAQVQVAFWDGEPREAEGLVRHLAGESVKLQLVGGSALAPEQHHANMRALFEGALWVGEDWLLSAELTTIVDSLARAQGESEGAGSLWIRGFLAGRRVAKVIDSGARTGEAVTRGLIHPDPALRVSGFLDCRRDGARLPVFTAKRNRAVEWAGR